MRDLLFIALLIKVGNNCFKLVHNQNLTAMTAATTKRKVLWVCFILAPLLQLIGDSLWVTKEYPFSWNLWREVSYIFFIPVSLVLAKMLEKHSINWAILCCGLFITGCIGNVAMMPLFRLGAFYPINGHDEFPAIVQSVLGKQAFAVTLFPLGLCFPLSFVFFGIGFLRKKIETSLFGFAFILAGILFFSGNALESDIALVIGDVFMLALLLYVVISVNQEKTIISRNQASVPQTYQP